MVSWSVWFGSILRKGTRTKWALEKVISLAEFNKEP